MIVELPRFLAHERPFWDELEGLLDQLETDPDRALSLTDARRLHYLYRRASSGLARLSGYASEAELRTYLETLVARAYGEIYSRQEQKRHLFTPLKWFFGSFPRVFRRHIKAFALAVVITLVGSLFGAGVIAFDPEAKAAIMPFPHLLGDPSERVAMEEENAESNASSQHTSFAAMLMTHNTRVSIFAMALGMTYGVGTFILLFYNGVILGAVCLDYIAAGESVFLAGWLLPHGSVEIPAILIAGQAGFVFASALIGKGDRDPMAIRMRKAAPDVATLIGGLAILLVWAGIIESFLSQYHEPAIPYAAKIAFGTLQLLLLFTFLAISGTGLVDKAKQRWRK